MGPNGTLRRLPEISLTIAAPDGVLLRGDLYLPPGEGPFAALLEALPYRKDDVTASYAPTYRRLVAEGGFAVCRLDLRGTGSSGGIADDEYPDGEVDDLATVVEWLASQPWSSGRVGMFGTSYSGFNSLHAAMAVDRMPALRAVCAIYATDDRYTDDVHYYGGVLRAIDLIDYCHYMVPMNALPPVPALWGDGWEDEWRRRVEETPAWLLRWLEDRHDGPSWRRGSVRTGPGGAGYERIGCPTMLVAGWADGYRNNTFRTVEHLRVPWRLLFGPWSHQSTATARPGPNLDLVPELIAWFDQHLRGGPDRHPAGPIQLFARHSTRPEPDLATMAGEWRYEPVWPPERLRRERLPAPASDPAGGTLAVRGGDVGVAAWISCAGGLPWGQPQDQRVDDARSLTYDWPPLDASLEILGHPLVEARVSSSGPVAHLSAKLCDVFPDGTSALITRGMLDLTHRGCWPADATGAGGRRPAPLDPGAAYDITVELEATSWVLPAGHRLRLALAGTDWPNAWPPAEPYELAIVPGTVVLDLPLLHGPSPVAAVPEWYPAAGASDEQAAPNGDDDDAVVWRVEQDVLARTVTAITHYGGTYAGTHGATVTDRYDGHVTASTTDPGRSTAVGEVSFEIAWPEATVAARSALTVASDAHQLAVTIELTTTKDGVPFAARRWSATYPRGIATR
jgi:predicted acyl esterase